MDKYIYKNSLDDKVIHIQRKRKKKRKIDYKRLLIALLVLASTVVLSVNTIGKLVDKSNRDKKLAAANDYMRTKIVYYLEKNDLDYSVLEDKILIENNQKKLDNLVHTLTNDGFEEDEVFYMISQICDEKDFDNIVKTYGYEDSKDFLRDRYPVTEVTDSGELITHKYGDMKVFENNIESDYVESVDYIKEMEESKGLNR